MMAANNFKWSDPGQHSHFLFFFYILTKTANNVSTTFGHIQSFAINFPLSEIRALLI